MRRIILLATVALLMAALMAMSALPALANHGTGPAPNVPPHQHYLITGNEKVVRVGPNVCANPNNQLGFNNFHHNVHVNPTHPTNVRATPCSAPPPTP